MFDDIDVEREAIRLLEAHGFDPEDPPHPIHLATTALGPNKVRRVQGLKSAGRWRPATDEIEVNHKLSLASLGFIVGHELGHRQFHHETGHDPERAESIADAMAGALIVPAPALRIAMGSLSYDLPGLADVFETTQSIVALRIAEILGTPTALLTPQRIIVRGDDRAWPPEPELRQLAKATTLPDGIERYILTDAPKRVVLVQQ